MNFAVLASGYGSNLQAIITAVKQKKIRADLKLVLSDKKEAVALERARKVKIRAVFVDPSMFTDRESFDRELIQHLTAEKIDFIVLAGFMRILSAHFIQQYPDKILNIHPSLLPAFKGAKAIKDAYESGGRLTGVTVHFVEEKVDGGPIIIQEAVAIKPNDTLLSLEARIHNVEHRLYPKAIDAFARGKLKIVGRKVIVGS